MLATVILAMVLPKKVIETLIQFNEDWIRDLKKSLNDPLQKAVGVDHIKLKIIELETELKQLKDELSVG